MQLDRFTTKSRQALEAASALAAARNHTEATPEHLLAVLLEQEDGIVVPVLNKLGARPEAIRSDVNQALEKLPKITGTATEPTLSRELIAVLRAAERELGAVQRRVRLDRAPPALARRPRLRRRRGAAPQRRPQGGHRPRDRVRPRPAPRDRREPRGQVPVAREVRPRPHARRRGGRARPRHRPRRRDPPRHPGPLAPHQEQPRPDRRARRRQDRDRRGPRPAHHLRRRPRAAARPPRRLARHRLAGGRLEVPRRVRGAPEGRPQGDRRRQGPDHPVHGRAAHDRRRRRRGGRGRRRQPPQADARPRRAARGRRDHARRVQEAHREGPRARAPLPADLRRRAVRRGHDRDPARAQGALRGAPPRPHHRRRADRRRDAQPPLHRRPLPPRQGDRPGRRVRLADLDRAVLRPDRDRRGRAPDQAARDRAGRRRQGRHRDRPPHRDRARRWPSCASSPRACAPSGSARRSRPRASAS